jgi:hypothetical protein
VSRAKSFAVPIAYVVLAALISITAIAVSSTDHPSIAARLRTAAADTQHWGTATVVGHITITIDGERTDVSDFTASSDFRAGNQAIRLSRESEVRTVDGVVYLRAPELKLPHDAHWVDITPAAQRNSASERGPRTNDPTMELDLLFAAARDPRLIGTETVDGERMTHYQFLLDPGTLRGIRDFGQVPAETWIDSSNRVRRIVLVTAVTGPSLKISERQDIRFANFGGPVDITAPDPDDVVAYTEVPGLGLSAV